jgi:hypothetical protein
MAWAPPPAKKAKTAPEEPNDKIEYLKTGGIPYDIASDLNEASTTLQGAAKLHDLAS